jgi:hypothetical protein
VRHTVALVVAGLALGILQLFEPLHVGNLLRMRPTLPDDPLIAPDAPLSRSGGGSAAPGGPTP